eukprot:6192783-Pleurochrysis_carterae.AAC.5
MQSEDFCRDHELSRYFMLKPLTLAPSRLVCRAYSKRWHSRLSNASNALPSLDQSEIVEPEGIRLASAW